jgi:hypothetical protein
MKTYKLKEGVTPLQLANKGFNIIRAGKNTIAVRNVLDDPTGDKALVIFLDPPKRIVEWRFVSSTPIEPYIQDFIELIDIETPPNIGENKTIQEWASKVHENAVNHGFWEKKPEFGDICSLMHSEISEAYEEYRKGGRMLFFEEDGKPDGIAVEFVDVIFRVFDFLCGNNINIESIMELKYEYNKKRPYKHGGKKT